MKRVHWESVGLSAISTSIWNDIDHEWFDYDPIMFELNFQTRKRKEKIQTDALQGNVGKESKDENDDNSNNGNNDNGNNGKFVDAKRSQMVQIGLRSFNMTNEELRDTILSLDEQVLFNNICTVYIVYINDMNNIQKLDCDHLIALIDIVPTPEEQIQAEKASQDTEIKYFGVVERFFYSVYDIVELKPRLNKWLFAMQFIDKCNFIDSQLDIIEQGKMTILRSNNLKEILSILLAFGNHMNYGNKLKGNAYGFHLNGLSLLPQIKTTDNSMTFPMFLWAFIKKKYPKLTRILQEFESVKKASHVAVDVIDKEYDKLQHEMRDLNAMITRYKEEYFELIDLDDMFLNDMTAFIVQSEKRMNELKIKMNNLHESEKELTDFFAYKDNENTKNVSLNSIFKDINGFIEMLIISKKKVKELEKENKKRQQREERKLRKKKRANTEHLTRGRFQEILNKSKDKKKKHKKKHHKKQHPLKTETDNNDNTETDGDNTEIIKIETITLGDAVKKRGKSRKSGYYDRTKHSSFDLFKRSHSKKKNIRFREETNDNDSKHTENDNNSEQKRVHSRKQTQDDMKLDQYAKMGLLQGDNDSDSDDDGDDDADIGVPGMFKSHSLHNTHFAVAAEINLSSETDEKEDKGLDALNVQRVRFDEDGKIHTLPSNLSMSQLKMITPRSDDNIEPDPIQISPPNISLSAQSLLDISVKRRNSDPGTPLNAISTRQRTDSGSNKQKKPLIAPSLTMRSSSFDGMTPTDDGAIDDDGLCVIEDFQSFDSNDSDNSNKQKDQLPDNSKLELQIDRTSNIRLSIHNSNKNKNKNKKKTVKINDGKKKNKKKGKNKTKKKQQQKRSKSKPAEITRAKSTRAALDLTATFF